MGCKIFLRRTKILSSWKMNPDSIAIPGIPTSFESYKSCKSSSKFGYIPAKECRSHFDLTIFFVRIIFARIWEFSLKLVGTHCSLHFKTSFIISSDDSVQFQSLWRNVIELLHLLESKNFAKTRNPNLKVNFITSCSNSCDLRYTHEKPFIQESPVSHGLFFPIFVHYSGMTNSLFLSLRD